MPVSLYDFLDAVQSMDCNLESLLNDINSEPSTLEDQPLEDLRSIKFTWAIDHFSRLTSKKLYSDIFFVGGYKWRLLIFPKGNNVDHLSLYLDVADSSTLPHGWLRNAEFRLGVINQMHTKLTITKDAQHQFNGTESDWGFTLFMLLVELYDPTRGYLVNDTVVIEAEVHVRKAVEYISYDSRKETGYVGLKNQGATCYMNSLLQTLYHIPSFRKAVYNMPTDRNVMPSESIPLALQTLFYKLQYSDVSVATKELTKSFGWDSVETFMQHDVQELNRVLCEKIENKMKGTIVEGSIQQLFEGYHMNYIECINVDYKSTRKESFYDLQLDVKGCRDVYASFDKYVEVERLEGENKYQAGIHGLQDARKGALFVEFPPVLTLHLKRFEYDFIRGSMVKIHDRYEFPLQLDLDKDNGKYLSPVADRSVRNLYTLHSVLVHSGGVNGGHYYAFIRPTLSEQWYKFDDERVTKEDLKKALEDQYGGEEQVPQHNPGLNNPPSKCTKQSNAYMLVYIRESDKERVMCNVDEKDIAEPLRLRLKMDQEEIEEKVKSTADAHLYTFIKVSRDEDLQKQIGKEIYFDLVDYEKIHTFRVLTQSLFRDFKEDIEKAFGIPVRLQRFWLCAERQNQTFRPARPLSVLDESQSIMYIWNPSNKTLDSVLKLFLEVETSQGCPVPFPEKSEDDILLFFKIYEPDKGKIRYAGRLYVKSSGKPLDIIPKLNQMAGFSSDQDIELYEEINFDPSVMCKRLDKKSSFSYSQLGDGDIICFQKPISNLESNLSYPDVPSFFEYIHNRRMVRFRMLEKPRDDIFCLELSKLHTYDDVVERVARQIGLDDSSKIRLTSQNGYTQTPKYLPIKYRGVEQLSDMLVHFGKMSDILYYESLDIPLLELQSLKNFPVIFHSSTKDEVSAHTLRLPKQSTVAYAINELKSKVQLSRPDAQLRLFEVASHLITKVYPLADEIESVNDQPWSLHAEEIPKEQENLGPQDRLIQACHFTMESINQKVQLFGDPFLLVVREGQTLAEIKVDVQKKLRVPQEEFVKWKFSVFSLGEPEYLHDVEVPFELFEKDACTLWEQCMGLEHHDISNELAHSLDQNRSGCEKPVRIYN